MTSHWAKTDPFNQFTQIISRNYHFFAKILTQGIPPTYEFPIMKYLMELDCYLFIFVHATYNTQNRMKHPTIILFTKFFIGFTPSYRHIMKRERSIPSIYDHVRYYTSKKTAEKYTRRFKCSVHFPCACCIPTNRRKVSTMI